MSTASTARSTPPRIAEPSPESHAREVRRLASLLDTSQALTGTLDLKVKADRDFDRNQKFLGVVASMISQAVKVQRLIDGERKRLVDENTHLRQELKERYDFSNLLGTSGPMRQICEQVSQVARTTTTVLIRGESGTGKELIAHALHYNSL